MNTGSSDTLMPIDEVGRRLGLRASAIRYYEQRGLIQTSRWQVGKRWFDTEQVRRLAAVLLWKDRGRLELGHIARFLGSPEDSVSWAQTIDTQIDMLTADIDRLQRAREFLCHVRHHHPSDTPDGCPHYESLLATMGQGAEGTRPE